VDRLRVGRSIRALRIEAGWRQSDVADVARVSRSVISRIERGDISPSSVGTLAAICHALSADLDIRVRWRGEGLDRLLDEAHAAVVDRFVRQIKDCGWVAAVEVTFNESGERGSVDVVGWHPGERALLIAEIKSAIPDAQATLVPLDRKTRLGAAIGERLGWRAAHVSKVLVVRDGSTNRRRVAEFDALFGSAFPSRGVAFRRWLKEPHEPIAALVFLPDSRQRTTRQGAGRWARVSVARSARKRSQ
jgi:transcriptional regulator with XRE-family HTH domain